MTPSKKRQREHGRYREPARSYGSVSCKETVVQVVDQVWQAQAPDRSLRQRLQSSRYYR